MINPTNDLVLTTQEACDYLRISRPTYLKYLYEGRLRAVKLGRGWKVLRSELDRFLRGEDDPLTIGVQRPLRQKELGTSEASRPQDGASG